MPNVAAKSGRGQSALSAFIADLPTGGQAPTRLDDESIVIATLLRHAAQAPSAAAARKALTHARRLAKATLLPWQIKDGPLYDEPSRPSPIAHFRLVVDRDLRRGHAALASQTLDSLQLLTAPNTLEGGRLLGQRSAISFFMGFRELAQIQAQQQGRLGRRLGEPELVARSLNGLAAVMWVTGNFPACVRLSKNAAKAAGGRLKGVASSATQALSVDAMLRGDFDTAVALAWRSYKLASGNTGLIEVSLNNFATILVDAGYPMEGRAVAVRTLAGVHMRQMVAPLLGTYAVASAALGDSAAVESALERVLELGKSPAFPRDVAESLRECAFALEHLGRRRRAAQIRERAIAIARRFGFYDIAYLAEHNMRRGVGTRPLATKEASRAIVASLDEVAEWDRTDVSLVGVHAG